MKLARIALIAVLSLPCTAQADIIRNPGPFTVPKTQFGCQNLIDYKELRDHVTLKEPALFARRFTRHESGSMSYEGARCMTIGKGATVTVRERWIGYECVNLKGLDARCFWIENVSGAKRQPDPYGESHYY